MNTSIVWGSRYPSVTCQNSFYTYLRAHTYLSPTTHVLFLPFTLLVNPLPIPSDPLSTTTEPGLTDDTFPSYLLLTAYEPPWTITRSSSLLCFPSQFPLRVQGPYTSSYLSDRTTFWVVGFTFMSPVFRYIQIQWRLRRSPFTVTLLSCLLRQWVSSTDPISTYKPLHSRGHTINSVPHLTTLMEVSRTCDSSLPGPDLYF